MITQPTARDSHSGRYPSWREWLAHLWQRFIHEMDVACLHPSVTAGMTDEELQAYIRMWT